MSLHTYLRRHKAQARWVEHFVGRAELFEHHARHHADPGLDALQWLVAARRQREAAITAACCDELRAQAKGEANAST